MRDQPSPPLLAARDLVIGYGTEEITSGITAEVHPGELVALTGPNGSGKSTLLKTVLGFLPPLRGDLEVLGRIPGSRGFRRRRTQIGYVSQTRRRGALPVTVLEAVAMGLYGAAGFGRRLSADHREAVKSAIETVRLKGLEQRRVEELSGGQTQRVAVARALAMRPQLLLLDEPLTHLDAESRGEIVELIDRIRHTVAVVLVTHVEDALRSCDAVYRFSNGRFIAEPPREHADA